MYENRDELLEDIYALEPGLRERGAEMRVLVESLMSANPNPVVRGEFVHSLRARLLPQQESLGLTTQHTMNWWFVHLMPVGAIALLALILVPRLIGPGIYTTSPTQAPGVAFEMSSEPSAKTMGGPDSVSLMQVANDPVLSADSFTMSNQPPGDVGFVDSVMLSVPGFVAIHRDAQGELGEIIGVSTLLNTGTSEEIPVSLTEMLREGVTYHVALYHDNGDGIFTPGYDLFVIEPTLNAPLAMPFGVQSPEAGGVPVTP